MKLKSLWGLTISLLVVLLASCDSNKPPEKVVWDMPTPYADSVFHTKNVVQFAEEVKRLTKNKLIIRIHSGASLYKLPEIKRAVRSGQVAIGETVISTLGNENPLYQIDVLPLLATGYNYAKVLWDVSRNEIEQLLKAQGLKLLYAVPWPPQGFYTQKEINAMQDMQGLKIRAYNAMLSRLVELMGGTPTTVQAPEIPQAFSTGIIDSMMTSPSTGVSSQAWDYVRYYYDFQAWIPKNMVFVNQKLFDKLTPEIQQAVLQAAKAAEERGWVMSAKETSEKTRILKEKGILVLPPTDELTNGLIEIRKIIEGEWLKEAGEKGKQMLDAYYKKTENL